MDNFEKILGEYAELVTDIHFDKSSYKVSVRFGTQIIPLKDATNKISISQESKGVYVYEISKNNGLEQLALFLKKTIDQNLEARAKSKLYSQVAQKLQTVFNEHSIEELQTLRFVFGDEANDITPVDAVDFSRQLEKASINSDSLSGDVREEKEEQDCIEDKNEQRAEKPLKQNVEMVEYSEFSDEEDDKPMKMNASGLVTGKVNVIV